MEKNTIIVIALSVLVLGLLVQAIQVSGLKSEIRGGTTTGNSIATSTNSGEETYEQMMARMHPDQVQATANNVQTTQNQVVGGC
ncbi:MAG: hypothetical protein AABW56_05225 [Nanoarchaeota archaeon]|mgnify:CR=1 FL=1